jgi:hypothetical protein
MAVGKPLASRRAGAPLLAAAGMFRGAHRSGVLGAEGQSVDDRGKEGFRTASLRYWVEGRFSAQRAGQGCPDPARVTLSLSLDRSAHRCRLHVHVRHRRGERLFHDGETGDQQNDIVLTCIADVVPGVFDEEPVPRIVLLLSALWQHLA